MSRSYRHSPFMGIAGHSDKPGKVKANRALRVNCNKAMANCLDWDNFVAPLIREVSNVWSFPKDGKQYLDRKHNDFKVWMRK